VVGHDLNGTRFVSRLDTVPSNVAATAQTSWLGIKLMMLMIRRGAVVNIRAR
jgi:hypothetical protein